MIYFLSLGSNLENKIRNLARAGRLLRESGVEVLAASSIYLTEPVDYADQPWFANQVVEVRSALDPPAFLRLAKSIEKKMKRVPRVDKGPRTIDIDILFAGETVLESQDLVLPHPRLARRNFVLVPLAEIAPDFVHPVLKKTIVSLARESADSSKVKGRAFGSPLARGLYPRASTAEVDPRVKPGAGLPSPGPAGFASTAKGGGKAGAPAAVEKAAPTSAGGQRKKPSD